jgi:hypothetical protein
MIGRRVQEVLGKVIQAIIFSNITEWIAFFEDIQGKKPHALFKPKGVLA